MHIQCRKEGEAVPHGVASTRTDFKLELRFSGFPYLSVDTARGFGWQSMLGG